MIETKSKPQTLNDAIVLPRTDQMGPRSSLVRVPAVYLTWANPLFSAFLPFSKFHKLRRVNGDQNPASPRRHHHLRIPSGPDRKK